MAITLAAIAEREASSKLSGLELNLGQSAKQTRREQVKSGF
jgi:hypothetical protein